MSIAQIDTQQFFVYLPLVAMMKDNVLHDETSQDKLSDKPEKIEVRDKITRTPPLNNRHCSVLSLNEQSEKSTSPGKYEKSKEFTTNPNKGHSGKTSPKSNDREKIVSSKTQTGKQSSDQAAVTKDSSQKPKDKKSNSKRDKSVSSKDNSSHKKTNDVKNRQHQSRSVKKLKSAENRRSSSNASNKRPRKESTEEECSENEIENDQSMDEDEKTDDSIKCPICEAGFGKDDSCIFCSCCRRWFHAACQDITEDEITAFRVLKKLAHYFCPQCSAGASELYKAQVKCREKVDRLEKKVEEIEADKEEMESNINTMKSQQTKNTAGIKTLDTVHKTLRKDVDEASTSIKNLKTDKKLLREDVEKCIATTQSNATKINVVASRLDTINENLIEKLTTLLDDKFEKKIKDFGKESVTPEPIVNEDMVSEKLDKMLKEKVEKLHDENSLKQKIDTEIKDKVNKINIEYNPYVSSASMEVDGATNNHQIVSRVFTSAVNNVVSEREEIERRKLQVVITNLKENNNPEVDENDAKEIFTLMKCNTKIVEAVRVGKVKADRPRPLRITVETLADKRNLLSKATSLRQIPTNHKFAYVYVKPNLTVQQQQQSKNLHVEIQEIRLKNPGKKFKITKGKIVEVVENQTPEVLPSN